MDKNLKYEILNKVKTVEEAENLSSEVDSILSSLYKVKNKDLSQILSKSAGKQTAAIIKSVLESEKISESDLSAVEKTLSGLKEDLKNAQVIKITLAIDPTTELISHIHAWVTENIGRGTLLETNKDESILGGAIIAVNGQYKDFSLKKSLENIFESHGSELLKSITAK